MSTEEKKEFKKDIERELIKRWWPLAVFMFAFGMFLVKGTNWFDNNIATKADTDAIKKEMQDMRKDFVEVKNTFHLYTQSTDMVHRGIHNRIDSLGRIVSLQHRGALTAHRDRFGNITYRPYIN